MPQLELKHYLIIAGVFVIMAYLTSVEKPLVTKVVTGVANTLFS